jgi:hypothetical protein
MARRPGRLIVPFVLLLSGTIAVAAVAASPASASEQCSYSLSGTSTNVSSTGTNGAVSIVTGAACSWTATSNDSWITVTIGSGGGISSMHFTVAANPGGTPRTGTITILGPNVTYTVNQAANSCTYSLSTTSASWPSGGTTIGAVSLVTGASCTWTATSNSPWITVTAGGSGTGLGNITYSVAPNTDPSPRSGSMTIAGINYPVSQAGSSGPPPPPPTTPQNLRIVGGK